LQKYEITKIEKFFSNSIVSWIVAVALLAISLLGSCYAEFLKNNISAFDKQECWIIWTLIVVFLAFFFTHIWAVNTVNKKHQNKLVNATEQLSNLVTTMPPEGFLAEFSKIYSVCHWTKNELYQSENKDKKNLEAAIRVILSSIITLIHTYERKPPENIIYGANIMVFNEKYKTAPPEEISKIEKSLLFSYPEIDTKKLKGILNYLPELSSNSTSKNPEIDEKLKDLTLSLPVPKDAYDHNTKLYLALPGAPLSFLLESVNQYDDTADLYTWVKEKGDFTENIANKIKEHFESEHGKTVKSFISFPIKSGSDNKVSAVLNIHKNKIGILSNKMQQNHFEFILSPIMEILSEILNEYLNKIND